MAEFSITGVDTLVDRLSTLPKKLQKKAAKIATRRAAAIIRDEARRLAKRIDIDDPVYKRTIWKNIRVQEATRSSRRVGGVVMRVGVAGGAQLGKKLKQRQAESADLPGKATQHWRMIEFGSENTRAQPFMRPAMESKANAAIEKLAAELSAAIDRLATSGPGAE
jgi:HK97 gp10 family phage protein